MQNFKYEARNSDGKLVKGTISAQSDIDLRDILASQSLTLVKSKEISKKTDSVDDWQKPNTLDVLIFSQQMHTLLRSGVPIVRALQSIEESTRKEKMKIILQRVRFGLDQGKPFSQSLTAFGDLLSGFYLSMIRVGENSGQLDLVFKRLYTHLHFQRQMKQQVQQALRYPLLVVLTIFSAIMVVNWFVIPSFSTIYANFEADLPVFTKILIAFSNFTINFWWLIVGGSIFSIFSFLKWKKTRAGGLQWSSFLLQLPIVGNFIHKNIMARFCQSFALCLESGLPIPTSLELVIQTLENPTLEEKLRGIDVQVQRGESLYRSCASTEIFDSIALQMILIGEETGSISELLKKVSDLYEEDLFYQLKNMTSLIEPILIVLLGVLVLVLALGIFLPIWDLSSLVLSKK